MSVHQNALRILIVEDSPHDREHYRRLLGKDQERTYDFVEVESGEEAIELCHTDPPDCVLLDYRLPDLHGLEFLDALVGEDGAMVVPAVMLTGEGNESIAAAAIKRGAADYLVKSEISADSLSRAVLHAIEKTGLQRKLARRTKELEQFVYVASHDLRAPMRTITGFCDLLAKKYGGTLDAKADKYLGMITDATGHMMRMLDSLLIYARVGRSSSAAKTEEIDLTKLVRTVCGLLASEIKDCEAKIDVEPLPVVKADCSTLTQVIQNLISNAIKFRGDVTPEIRVTAQQDGELWRISVKDNGIGIDPKYHQDVMTPFRRLHSMSEYEGTGLGLAICTKAIQHLGGTLWVESAPGDGSTFHFTVPAADSSGTASVAPPEPAVATAAQS